MKPDERSTDELLERVGRAYNAPPATPRDAMWTAIEARLDAPAGADMIDLEAERRRRAGRRWPFAWAAAAAAVLVLGIGIGRMSAPVPELPRAVVSEDEAPSALTYAAAEHLERTELLLRLVRSDASRGAFDPLTREWAQGLLLETRLLLDAGVAGGEPAMHVLFEDLELVLAQIVGAMGGDAGDGERARSELGLALGGLERSGLLARIEAVAPLALAGA